RTRGGLLGSAGALFGPGCRLVCLSHGLYHVHGASGNASRSVRQTSFCKGGLDGAFGRGRRTVILQSLEGFEALAAAAVVDGAQLAAEDGRKLQRRRRWFGHGGVPG